MTVATLFGPNMTLLTGNAGGAVESLPQINQVGGKNRSFIERLTLASQPSGSVIAVGRIPLFATFMGIELVTSVSLGSSTIAFGDANTSNLYGAAATLTSTNTVVWATASATHGLQVNTGYDCQTGNAVGYAAPGGGGALYEDILMTVAVANLPASGTLIITTNYMID